MNREIDLDKVIIWDRQDKKFCKIRDYNTDEKNNREYFKHTDCNLWLENGVALDVFEIQKSGELKRREVTLDELEKE